MIDYLIYDKQIWIEKEFCFERYKISNFRVFKEFLEFSLNIYKFILNKII